MQCLTLKPNPFMAFLSLAQDGMMKCVTTAFGNTEVLYVDNEKGVVEHTNGVDFGFTIERQKGRCPNNEQKVLM